MTRLDDAPRCEAVAHITHNDATLVVQDADTGNIWCECASFNRAVTIAQALQRHLMGRPQMAVLRGDEIKYDTRNGYTEA